MCVIFVMFICWEMSTYTVIFKIKEQLLVFHVSLGLVCNVCMYVFRVASVISGTEVNINSFVAGRLEPHCTCQCMHTVYRQWCC
jgi:hypothetical protein